ncbi:MAG TPA: hypothetical protein VJW73_01045 [Gemmatimonadaceae bacterium]|nr:hypothetical protein [Gemmatimonadaceae bacterium]
MTVSRFAVVLSLVFGATASRASAQAMGQTVNGISCDAQEGQRIHIHQHLAIFDHGKEVTVPQFIGIPQAARCIYWLHTHTPDGIIHVEAPRDRSFTLGDFFAVWGQQLDRTHAASAAAKKRETMRVFVNGARYTGNPAQIPLTAHADIVIQVGPPFKKPVPFTNWGAL